MKQYESTRELLARLKIAKGTLYRLMKKGLPSVLVGKQRRFDPVAVDRWLARQEKSQRKGRAG